MAGAEAPAGAGGAVPPDMGGEDPPNVLLNENPVALSYAYEMVVTFVQLYGWYLVLVSLGLVYLLVKLRPRLRQWAQQAEDVAYSKKYDSGTALMRQEAMDAARRKMQGTHDRNAAKFAEEAKLREEKKRLEKIDSWERHQTGRSGTRGNTMEPAAGTSSKSRQTSKKKAPLRPVDYNPLTGTSSSGAAYRPPRRGGSGGG